MPSPSPAVVTRIAPSPTGQMHIGTARTALFNLLYARHCGGTFLLRVEDTDRERSTPEAVRAIFDGLEWLGLNADAPAVFQSQRADRHREVVDELLRRGGAYRDWTTPAELEVERERARAEGRVVRSPWRDRSGEPDGRPFVVRLRAPLEGETQVDDLVKGVVRFSNSELDDLVLLRSDGMPTYNLAVVVDDHDMAVTHVIRGDDHLNNAARQTLIYRALGWTLPAFAHLPLIHGPDGAKLSKRHGAQAVGEFRQMGYLPEAMRNYLARIGWGHGDAEVFTDDQAIAWFDVADVVKAPGRLDWAKLNFINQHYLRVADETRLSELVRAVQSERGEEWSPDARARLGATIPLVKEGAQTVVELADLCVFALKSRPLTLDAKTLKLLDAETSARLSRLRDRLRQTDTWSREALDLVLREFARTEGVGIGRFGAALRGVLSGGAAAPDLASTMAALGCDETTGRLDDALSPSAGPAI